MSGNSSATQKIKNTWVIRNIMIAPIGNYASDCEDYYYQNEHRCFGQARTIDLTSLFVQIQEWYSDPDWKFYDPKKHPFMHLIPIYASIGTERVFFHIESNE